MCNYSQARLQVNMGVTAGWERAIQGVSVTATPSLLGTLVCSRKEAPIHVLCGLRGRAWGSRGVSECWAGERGARDDSVSHSCAEGFFCAPKFSSFMFWKLVMPWQISEVTQRVGPVLNELVGSPLSAIVTVAHRGHSYQITLHEYFAIGFHCDEIHLWHIFSSREIPNLVNKLFFS